MKNLGKVLVFVGIFAAGQVYAGVRIKNNTHKTWTVTLTHMNCRGFFGAKTETNYCDKKEIAPYKEEKLSTGRIYAKGVSLEFKSGKHKRIVRDVKQGSKATLRGSVPYYFDYTDKKGQDLTATIMRDMSLDPFPR